MATVGSLIVEVGANVARLQRDLGKMQKDINSSTRQMKRAFSGVATAITAMIAAVSVKKIVDVTTRQQNALNQLEVAVKSTGGAARQTVPQLAEFAASMQQVTTYGDEAVMEMQSVLLTFTKVSGSTFPRASKAILDVATRMGTDLKSAALQVGKALNDPVANMGALSRAGIQFTKEQKELIKGFWETGQVAQAQAVILKELEVQFGGSAEAARDTLGGALAALSNAFWDLFEISKSNAAPLVSAINFVARNMETLLGVATSLVALALPYMFVKLAHAIKEAAEALIIFNAAAAANPFILIASAISGILVALWTWRKELGLVLDTAQSITGQISDFFYSLARYIVQSAAWWENGFLQILFSIGTAAYGITKLIGESFVNTFKRILDFGVAFGKDLWANLKSFGTAGFQNLGAEVAKGFSTGFVSGLKNLGDSIARTASTNWLKEFGLDVEALMPPLKAVAKSANDAAKGIKNLNDAAGSGKTQYMIDGVLMTLDEYIERLKFTSELSKDFMESFDQLPSLLSKPIKEAKGWLEELAEQWTDTSEIAKKSTEEALRSIQQGFANIINGVLVGDIENLGDVWSSVWRSMVNIFSNAIAQILTGWVASGLGSLFNLGASGGSTGGGVAGSIASSIASSAAWAGIKSGLSSAASALGLTGVASWLGASGATAAGAAGLGAGASGAVTFGSLAGASGSVGAGGAAAGSLAAGAGLSAMAGPLAAALGPGMIGMLFNDQISSLLGREAMTPERAISNWGGTSNFLESLTKQMQTGSMTQGVGSSFGFYSDSAEEAYRAFQQLATVAGYTQEQLDAAYNSLSPLARKLLDSGKAALETENNIRAMAREIAVTKDTTGLTGDAVAALQAKIDAMAASFGLSGDAARDFSNDIWEASESMWTGAGAIIEYDDAIGSLADSVVDSMSALANSENGIVAITNATSGLADAMTGLATSASRAASATGGIKGTGVSTVGITSRHIGYVPKLHTGLASDEYVAVLQRGEPVIRRSSVNSETGPVLDEINRTGRVPGGGGQVLNFTINADSSTTAARVKQAVKQALAEANNRGVTHGYSNTTAPAV